MGNPPRKATGKTLEDWIDFAAKRKRPTFFHMPPFGAALPDSIGRLVNVKRMDFCDGGLTALPDAFAQLDRLEILHLSRNAMAELPPALRHCKSLRVLNVSGNKIASIPRWIAELTSLEVFICCDNPSRIEPDVSFPPSLQYLDVSRTGCDWSGDSLRTVKQLRRLSQTAPGCAVFAPRLTMRQWRWSSCQRLP